MSEHPLSTAAQYAWAFWLTPPACLVITFVFAYPHKCPTSSSDKSECTNVLGQVPATTSNEIATALAFGVGGLVFCLLMVLKTFLEIREQRKRGSD